MIVIHNYADILLERTDSFFKTTERQHYASYCALGFMELAYSASWNLHTRLHGTCALDFMELAYSALWNLHIRLVRIGSSSLYLVGQNLGRLTIT